MFPRSALAGLFVVALAGCSAPDPQLAAKIDAQTQKIAEIQTSLKGLQSDLKKSGRFQVMNGTPQFARNIMLLDTETGRVWLMCETKGRGSTTSTNWCAMDFNGTAANP